MTSFEVQHPRATDGTFTEKAYGVPEVALTGASVMTADEAREDIWSRAVNQGTAENVPMGAKKTAVALRNARGEAGTLIRRVILTSRTTSSRSTSDYDVVGPRDGRPILVDVRGGMFRLKVTSGHAIIRSDSAFGNVVEVAPGARATVLVEPGRKLSSSAAPEAELDIHAGPDSRGYQHVAEGARVTAHGHLKRMSGDFTVA